MATAGRHAPFTFADLHGHLLMSHESRIQAKECYLRYKTDPSYQGRPPSNFQSYVANPSSSTNTSAEWSMCSDDSEILFLKFENRCPSKGCPAQIRRAIVTFDGVRETRSVDYDKGTAELIVNAEIAKNPQKLCNWILKETRKHALVDNTYNTSYLHEDSHGHGERKEKIVFREHRHKEVRITNYYSR
ncbi:hypothetical protein FCM35_KLT08430 [Carex littledalei]|uniref:Uncharacterized protein n=1 Tax=Carex littledalei TaxID=544730 RepID=A0A833QHY4_9POAL|nr:hypothetical protein FCM35_KLT08430 [Carex littledalei]